uniref:Uncharacterized protein n=1 Tax=Mimivirus LCMiAC01 TaxID=2506608 RepID=A0A481Z1D0_9VIRU|nr:MAG: hypothetical protein LCMiAC01_05670 [Mimivirus LCMiAC01]
MIYYIFIVKFNLEIKLFFTTKEKIEYFNMLKEEIISLYKDKSMSRKKFRKYIKEFINRMLDNEYIILKKYGLTT